MNEQEGFIAAILSGGLSAVLPFVDWLEERGDPRARLLRIRFRMMEGRCLRAAAEGKEIACITWERSWQVWCFQGYVRERFVPGTPPYHKRFEEYCAKPMLDRYELASACGFCVTGCARSAP